jgi:hypothetical protein
MTLHGLKRPAMAALLLTLIAGGVSAQTVVQDGTSFRRQIQGAPVMLLLRADSTGVAATGDASGNTKVAEAFPPTTANVTHSSIITSSSLAYNAGDSSAIINVSGLRHMKLLIKAVPASTGLDTTAVSRLVFQVRTHLTGLADSSSTFVEYSYGVSNLGVAAGAADSATYGHLVKGGRNLAWSGEFIVQAASIRTAHASAVAINGHEWYWPSGHSISLDNLMGRDFWTDYISIRVRNITNNACAVTVHLVGTPL